MGENERQTPSVGLGGGWKKLTVLVVGAEGEALTVEGRRHVGPWQFRTEIDSRTLSLFTDDLESDVLLRESGWKEGWNEVLEFLDKDRTWTLWPVFVHPEFAEAVRDAVAARALPEAQVRNWMRAIEKGYGDEEPWRTRDVFTVDVSAGGSPVQGLFLACSATPTVQTLLNVVFSAALQRKVPVGSYGDAWVLHHMRTREAIKKIGRTDRRGLAEINVLPGDVLRLSLIRSTSAEVRGQGEDCDFDSLEDP